MRCVIVVKIFMVRVRIGKINFKSVRKFPIIFLEKLNYSGWIVSEVQSVYFTSDNYIEPVSRLNSCLPISRVYVRWLPLFWIFYFWNTKNCFQVFVIVVEQIGVNKIQIFIRRLEMVKVRMWKARLKRRQPVFDIFVIYSLAQKQH